MSMLIDVTTSVNATARDPFFTFQMEQNGIRVLVFTESDGSWHAESEELTAFGCGDTAQEALEDFRDSIHNAWETLKDMPNPKMTEDAIELRESLRRYFEQ